ncbi:hypothetical protein ACJX0J_040301, partial [Zea mays]
MSGKYKKLLMITQQLEPANYFQGHDCQYQWEQEQMASMMEYIARFGPDSAKLQHNWANAYYKDHGTTHITQTFWIALSRLLRKEESRNLADSDWVGLLDGAKEAQFIADTS